MCMCMLLACACACYLPTTVCLVISNMLAWLIKVSRTGILSVGYTDFPVPSRPKARDHLRTTGSRSQPQAGRGARTTPPADGARGAGSYDNVP